MIHKGQKIVFGVPEMLRHCDAQWYAYLERLVNNPKEQNPFERYEGADLRHRDDDAQDRWCVEQIQSSDEPAINA